MFDQIGQPAANPARAVEHAERPLAAAHPLTPTAAAAMFVGSLANTPCQDLGA
jgi:hypothetical protein